MKIMNSLCPPSKKMVHIALCMSVGWSVCLDSRFPNTCERKIQITWLLRLQLSSLYWRSLSFCRPRRGGARSSSIPTLLLRGDNVYFHKDCNCYICIDAAAAEWHIPWYDKYKIKYEYEPEVTSFSCDKQRISNISISHEIEVWISDAYRYARYALKGLLLKPKGVISKQYKHMDRIVTTCIYYNYYLCTFMVVEK